MRALDPEVPRVFRTATGTSYERTEASRVLAPWARASIVTVPSGEAVLVELPGELLHPEIVLADRRASDGVHVLTMLEVGVLSPEASGGSATYRTSAPASDLQHYALFPRVPGASMLKPLQAARRGRVVSPTTVATLAVEIAAGLADTEQLGPLRPESIVVSWNGRAHVRGALLEHIAQRLDGAAVARPRLAYLAPELVRSGPPQRMDGRGRLFALGLMLTELATGRELLPDNPSAARALADWSLKLPELPNGLPRELRAALWALLQRDPDRRAQPAMLVDLLAPLYEPGPQIAAELGIASDGPTPYL